MKPSWDAARWCVALAGAAALAAASAPWGIGLSPDSAAYISAARRVSQGLGLTLGWDDGRPMTQWPPGYPLLLALGALFGPDPLVSARWLQVVLFALSGALAGAWIRRLTGRPAAGFLTTLWFVTSRTMWEVHGYAHTEPLALLLGFAGLWGLARWCEKPGRLLWLGSVAAIAAAWMTRYAGVAYVWAGVIAAALWCRPGPGRRLLRASGLLIACAAPMALWFGRNQLLSSTLTNRVLEIHLPPPQLISQFLDTLTVWLLPEAVSRVIRWPLGAAWVAGLLWAFRRRPSARESGRDERVLALFGVCYLAVLAVYILTQSVNMPPVPRLLSPCFAVAVWLTALAVPRWLAHRRAAFRAVLLIGLAVLFAASAARGAAWAHRLWKDGAGFSSRAWAASPAMEALRRRPPGGVLYTNAPDAVYLLAGRPSREIPRRYDRNAVREQDAGRPGTERPAFPAEVRSMLEAVEGGGEVWYFDLPPKRMGRWFFPSEEELARLLLRERGRWADGVLLSS